MEKKISKKDTAFKKASSVQERLALTLRFDKFYDTFLSPLHFTITKTFKKPHNTRDSHHSSRQKHQECKEGQRSGRWWRVTLHVQTCSGRNRTGWFTLYVTFPFRRGTSPFSKIFSWVFKRISSHWQERLRQVSVPFCRRARMFDGTDRVRTGLNQLDSDNVNSQRLVQYISSVLLARSAAWFLFGKCIKN